MIEKHILDIDGRIYLEDVPCFFDVSEEEYVEEPYTYGWSRRKGKVVDVSFKCAVIGNFKADCRASCEIFGEEAIKRIEEHVRENRD